jgi:diguanylate cyclase (GGDEF)-like protein
VSICTQELRNSDYIGRLGGEEFAIVLRESDAAAGVDVADRLRSLIAREKFIALKGPFSVTASLGVAALDSAIVDSAELLALADAALYEAKTTGRNRVVLHDRASRRLSLAS